MSAISAKKDVRRQPGEVLSFKMEESTTIYEGALVSVNAAGYAVNATDAANDLFIGVADEKVVNSGADGAKEIKVRIGGVIDLVAGFSAAQSNLGDLVYVTDNQTVDLAATTTNDVLVGRIVEVTSASKVRVALVTPGRA